MKRISALFLAALMLFTLSACGSAAKDMAASTTEAAMPMEAAEWYAEENGSGFSAGTTAAAAPAERQTEEKIIYTGDAGVETTHFDDTLSALQTLIDSYGGYIQSASVNGANYYSASRGYRSLRSAYYTIRIPAERFPELMSSLSALGNVPYSNVSQENITARYYDVQARLEAYRTQEQTLLALMEKAESIEDIITIEARLSDLRYEMESLETALRSYDRQVSYSTLNLSVSEVEEYTPQAAVRLSYGEKLAAAFTDGVKAVGRFAEDALLFLAEALPTLVLLAAAAAAVAFLGRGIKKRRFRRRMQRVQEANEAARREAEK